MERALRVAQASMSRRDTQMGVGLPVVPDVLCTSMMFVEAAGAQAVGIRVAQHDLLEKGQAADVVERPDIGRLDPRRPAQLVVHGAARAGVRDDG